MSVEQFPSFLQDEEYSAETLRHVFGTLLARGSAIGSIVGGLVASTDMQVTAGSGMQVLVATGEAWIPGTSVSTQGGYLGRVTSSTALAISAASESNPRIETIIAQIQDKAVAGGTDSFSVSVVVGTATSGATLVNKLGAGSVPASSLVLAYVLVPAKAVSIVSGDIENVATVVAGGLAPGAGSVGTSQLAALAVTAAKLAGEAVTDAKVVKGRALIQTENTYSEKSYTKAEAEAGVEPSPTRQAFVYLGTGGFGSLTVGGAKLPFTIVASFWVPPGKKWTYTAAIEAATIIL